MAVPVVPQKPSPVWQGDCFDVSYDGKCFVMLSPRVEGPTNSQRLYMHLRNVKLFVRICTREEEELNTPHGYKVVRLYFDSFFPKVEVLKQWCDELESLYNEDPDAVVAVQCQVGMRNNAFLVAIGLIELGLPAAGATQLIEEKLSGAFLTPHYYYLHAYEAPQKIQLSVRVSVKPTIEKLP